jgi:afadin
LDNSAEAQPPLPPTSTHPLFKVPTSGQPHQGSNASPAMNYNSTDASKVGMFPNSQQHAAQKNSNNNSNPWDREEREKEHEMRREQIRQWRDQQIVELSLLPARTPQQEEQLKTLVLERDFERRAQEEDNEEDNENQYQKNVGNIQEVLRLQPSSNGQASQSTRLKQSGDMKPSSNNVSPNAENSSPPSNDNSHSGMPPPIQPKSILKSRADAYNGSNPSSPSKAPKSASFAQQNLTELTISNTTANQMITQLNKDLGELKLDFHEEMNGQAPPPPPERGSSFAVMNQKVRSTNNFQKISFNDQINNNKYTPTMNNNNNEHSPMMMSPSGTFTAQQIQQQLNLINNNSNFVRDNKRVSFHDHENNNNNNTSEIVSEHDLSLVRGEDPNVSLI